MKASQVIKELEERIEIYGDYEVIWREYGDDIDFDVMSVYGDDDTERIVISNAIWWD